MKSLKLLPLLLSATVCVACHGNESGKIGSSCSENADCVSEAFCMNGVCVQRCTQDMCQQGTVCTEEGMCVREDLIIECNDAKPCADINKMCLNNKCITKPECNSTIKCADETKVCVNQKCVDPPPEPECSDDKPCEDLSKVCSKGACVDFNVPDSCITDTECGREHICDNKKCVPKGTCSETRTCGDEEGNTVCYEGKCVPRTLTACDKTHACADTAETCVAGKCVKCNCKENEVCQTDGTCTAKNHSEKRNVNVGDPCDYKEFKSYCDGNRLFTCSQVVATEDHMTVKVNDCGADVCATSVTDGVGCYDPCAQPDELYGACLNDYSSDTGSYTGILFRYQCSKSEEGDLIWSFTEGYEICDGMCAYGNCMQVPDELGGSCYENTYVEHCSGDWSVYCTQENIQYPGFVNGLNCKMGYGDDYSCVVTASDGWTDCAKPCKEPDAKSVACHTYSSGKTYSENYICEKAKDGKYYNILDGNNYTLCAHGCDESTGLCK